MSGINTKEDIIELMKPMIAEARAKGFWLCSTYQRLWFSPDQLELVMSAGKFCWGPANWQILNPIDRLKEFDILISEGEKAREEFKKNIDASK
jgi:hypothetical protein